MKLSERTKRSLRLLWVAAILGDIVASLLPADSLPIRSLDKLAVNDKLEHTVMYAILAVLPAILERRRLVAAAALGAVALGIVLEYMQLLSGWRTFEYGDMVASAAGVGVGLAAGIFVRTVLRRQTCKHGPEGQFSREDMLADARGPRLWNRGSVAMEQDASD